jgi:hypothetical protein
MMLSKMFISAQHTCFFQFILINMEFNKGSLARITGQPCSDVVGDVKIPYPRITNNAFYGEMSEELADALGKMLEESQELVRKEKDKEAFANKR